MKKKKSNEESAVIEILGPFLYEEDALGEEVPFFDDCPLCEEMRQMNLRKEAEAETDPTLH